MQNFYLCTRVNQKEVIYEKSHINVKVERDVRQWKSAFIVNFKSYAFRNARWGFTLMCFSFFFIHPLKFCRKMHFEASRAVFWSVSCNKEPKLTIKPFTGCTLGRLLTQKQNISLRSSGMHRKQNFEIVFGFKSYTAVLTFTFRFLYSPLLSLFLPHFVFFGRAFSRLYFGGKRFWESF